MPVRKTGQLPENIDRQINEIIRAFSEMEEQIRQIRKASDPRIGDNAEYIDRHVRNLKNPHSVTAKQVKALPLASVLDPSSICFPFQNSLVSTRGETPIGLYGSSITDYGLVTGNGLCATLLPEGGVAVTEGTENLFNIDNVRENYAYVSTEIISDYHVIAYYDNPDGGAGNYAWSSGWFYIIYDYLFQLGDYTISFEARIIEQGKYTPTVRVRLAEDNIVLNTLETIQLSRDLKRFEVSFTVDETTNTADSIQIALNSNSVEFKNIQLEPKPYSTPFTEGTRPAGALSYNLPISINGDWTIAKWLELEPYYRNQSYNTISKGRMPLIELGNSYYSNGHGILGIYGSWYSYDTGDKIRIVANKDQNMLYSESISLTEMEYNNRILAVLIKSDHMLTGYIYTASNKHTLTCDITSLGDISQIAPRLNYHTVTASSRMYSKRHLNTLVCPYAVSPETVATWHSLNSPFIDPFIPPSQGVPYFNTPDEFINSTANFAMVNVDGIVKLYARTPDKTIIIETLGNTEVV